MARQLGIDRLLGGTDVAEVKDILAGTPTRYYPFPGFPIGHPTRLGGQPADVTAHCRRFVADGCAGADLLAYRATEANPLELVRAARQGLGDEGYLVVAGSITSRQRIADVAAAGADAFTIGTAVFDGSYNPRKGSILSQLGDVIADCETVFDRLMPTLGIDIGTQSLKALVLGDDMRPLGAGGVAYRATMPKPGWAEQDTRLWLDALRPAIGAALHGAPASPDDIDGAGGLRPARRLRADRRRRRALAPAVIWMDRRAESLLAGIDTAAIHRRCGLVLDATHMGAKIGWFDRNLPERREVATGTSR